MRVLRACPCPRTHRECIPRASVHATSVGKMSLSITLLGMVTSSVFHPKFYTISFSSLILHFYHFFPCISSCSFSSSIMQNIISSPVKIFTILSFYFSSYDMDMKMHPLSQTTVHSIIRKIMPNTFYQYF